MSARGTGVSISGRAAIRGCLNLRGDVNGRRCYLQPRHSDVKAVQLVDNLVAKLAELPRQLSQRVCVVVERYGERAFVATALEEPGDNRPDESDCRYGSQNQGAGVGGLHERVFRWWWT